ncbi:MAG: hypothetical protein ACPGYY_10210 [Bacteroidia bacterium]
MKSFFQKFESYLLASLALGVASFLLFLHYISPGLEGGMDSYNHFLIAKNTWSHPKLFLDQWGKPLYNILASPFAQFGLTGMVVLNVISLILCAVLSYRITKLLRLRFAFIAFILTLFSPIFLDNTISSLTEPLCALMVLLSVYLIIDKKIALGTIVAGLLPYARSEGFIVMAIVGLYLIVVLNDYKKLIFLLAGSLIFNTLGWIIEGEPFWLITQNPYINFELSGRNVCGSGGLLSYVRQGHYTFGLITSGLLALSTIAYAANWAKSRKPFYRTEIALLLSIFILYFLAHSFIWWQGMMGSCGYVRVMVVIAPIASIACVYAINVLLNILRKHLPIIAKPIQTILILIVCINAVYVPYRYYAYKYPLAISEEQAEYTKLADWYKTSEYQDRTKIYLYPYFSIIGDIDPYSQTEHLDLWASTMQYTKKGDIIIWDSHFGPNESGIPLSQLENDENWVKIHSILPEKDIITLNDAVFKIHVFEKIK